MAGCWRGLGQAGRKREGGRLGRVGGWASAVDANDWNDGDGERAEISGRGERVKANSDGRATVDADKRAFGTDSRKGGRTRADGRAGGRADEAEAVY